MHRLHKFNFIIKHDIGPLPKINMLQDMLENAPVVFIGLCKDFGKWFLIKTKQNSICDTETHYKYFPFNWKV